MLAQAPGQPGLLMAQGLCVETAPQAVAQDLPDAFAGMDDIAHAFEKAQMHFIAHHDAALGIVGGDACRQAVDALAQELQGPVGHGHRGLALGFDVGHAPLSRKVRRICSD